MHENYCMPRELALSANMSALMNVASLMGNNTSLFDQFPVAGSLNLSDNMSMLVANNTNTQAALKDSPARAFLKGILVPVICVFGMVGNLLTLFILTRKRLKSTCDGTERTVHISLLALAVSDLLLCLCLLPHGIFKKEPFAYQSLSFQLIHRAYGEAMINTFILTSTWLTVTMALSRYLAIVHPFKARHIIGMTGTKASILAVFLICLVFNLPRFFEVQIESLDCIGGTKVYFKNMNGYFKTNTSARIAFVWIYFTFGIFLPLTLLAFCNICLVRALWESSKLRKRYRVPAAHVDSNYRITSILVTIVLMYILLVSPAEILLFLEERLSDTNKNAPEALLLAIEVTNVLQTINFSCNFVLYFILNVHFRKALRDMFCRYGVCRDKKHPTYKGAMMLNRATSLRQSATTQTCVLVESKHPDARSPQWEANSAANKHTVFSYEAAK